MTIDSARGARKRPAWPAMLALCAAGAAAAVEPKAYEPPPMNETTAVVETPETTVRNWPALPRSTALALIEKYGEPILFDDDSLTWDENGPWEETVVHRAAPLRLDRYDPNDILEQKIFYEAVPAKKIAALEDFDSRIAFDRETRQLTSRAASESLNYLALNLADEIVNDKRKPAEARDFYRSTLQLSAAGKSSPYLSGFLFPVKSRRAARPTR